MGKGDHLIRKWTFDIQYTDKQTAKPLQDKFSTLFNHHLSDAAEKVISRVVAPLESAWIPRIEIDLGVLPYGNFEQDIIRLLPEALEKALKERIGKARQQQGPGDLTLHFSNETDRYYALLGHYLRTGSMPWWAQPEESSSLEQIVLQLISDSSSRFSAFITAVAQQDYVLKRIAYHFSRHVVKQIITSLEEEQATFIFAYITGALEVHNKQPLVQSAQSEFERAVWLFVLTYLVTDNSGQFNRKQFIRRHLERLASHFNVDYVRLLYIFRRAIDHYKQYIPSDSFVTFIQVLYEENAAAGLHSQQARAFVAIPESDYDNVIAPRLLPMPGAMQDIPLPVLWINYDTILAKEDREEVWQQAVNLFRIFMTGQPLPAWFGSLQAGRQEILLKQAVILLFRKRPMLLASLWEHPVHSINARLQVHQLFDKPVTPLEETIRKQLQTYAEQDTLQFLQQALPHTFIQHRNSFREIWLQYQQRSHEERLTFYRNVLAPVAVLQQVALHTSDEDFQLMMKDAVPLIWGNNTTTALQEWQALMESLTTDNLERERVRLLFRRFNLLWLSGKLQINSSESYITNWVQFMGTYDETTMHKLLKAIVSYTPGATNFIQIRTVIPVLQQATAELLKSTVQAPVLPALVPERAVITPTQQLVPVQPESRPYESLFAKAPPVAGSELEAVPIQNAGLVLLHPFLHTYFSRLQLLTKNQFTDEAARHKAVRLLQLLVDGGTDHPEHTLLLNKVLCNLPWEVPLDPDITITDSEKELSLQLIGAAIQQWPKMHNSSPEGFRASFLKREGVLWQTEEAWFVKVQPRSYDIILQTLPWSYGMIKPSWLPKVLYTEWTTT